METAFHYSFAEGHKKQAIRRHAHFSQVFWAALRSIVTSREAPMKKSCNAMYIWIESAQATLSSAVEY